MCGVWVRTIICLYLIMGNAVIPDFLIGWVRLILWLVKSCDCIQVSWNPYIYTDFSKKTVLTNKNVSKFLKSFSKKKYKKETDLLIGFFGYNILCNLLNLKTKNQKTKNRNGNYFYASICSLTWPNLSFLVLFFLDFCSKMWFEISWF